MTDLINHPPHYNAHPSSVECIDIAEAFNFNLGNAVKYIWRAGLKGPDPLVDLRKAQWYVAREIRRIEAEQIKPVERRHAVPGPVDARVRNGLPPVRDPEIEADIAELARNLDRAQAARAGEAA